MESNVVRRVIREIGERRAESSDQEASRIRRFFSEQVLPHSVTSQIQRKHLTHVDENMEWPQDTTPDEYLASLRAIVVDERSGIYLEYSDDADDWTVYLVGRARRGWRGPSSAGWIVVLFNADRSLWVTGFQPERARDYVEDRNGFWARRPR